MSKIRIAKERCKGCHLCIPVCPKKILAAADHYNQNGYVFVLVTDEESCTGCALCAEMCPDICIEVWKETRTSAG
jgi:2-oxoglutarate ferredoxin oxidoreductase subunit delta